MKYSQFSEFTDLLKKNKIKLDEWKKNPDMTLIKEADEVPEEDGKKKELDTKKGNVLTKRGRQRMALNKHAKKLQEQINKDIADKFLKPIFDLKAQSYKKMAEMGKGKQPKEIIAALKGDLVNLQKTQAKQMATIEQSAQKSIDLMTQKIEATLDKSKLKDNTKGNLKSYWNLLTTQIMMNLLQKIAVKDDALIGETIQDPEIVKAAKVINKAINKDLAAKIEQGKTNIENKKTEQLKLDKQEDAAPAEPEGEKSAEPEAEKTDKKKKTKELK